MELVESVVQTATCLEQVLGLGDWRTRHWYLHPVRKQEVQQLVLTGVAREALPNWGILCICAGRVVSRWRGSVPRQGNGLHKHSDIAMLDALMSESGAWQKHPIPMRGRTTTAEEVGPQQSLVAQCIYRLGNIPQRREPTGHQ